MHGTTQDIGISSIPSQAEIQIDNQNSGKTPYVAKLSRGENHILSVKLDGYQPYETTLTKSVSGWVLGNILIGGLIGLAVDAISGGIYTLSPEQINAVMASNTTNSVKTSKDGLVSIFVVLKPLPGWKKVASLKPAKFPYSTSLN